MKEVNSYIENWVKNNKIIENSTVEKKSLKSIIKKLILYYKTLMISAEQRRNIEIFTIISEIKTPLSGCQNKFANCKIGDFIIIIDESVFVRDWNVLGKEQFSQASYSPDFVRANTTLFQKA